MPTFRRTGDTGNSPAGPVRSRRPWGVAGASGRDAAVGVGRAFTADQQFEDEIHLWNPRSRPEVFDDFLLGGHTFGNTTSLSAFATRTTGTPTGVAKTNAAANGILTATLAATNEAEFAGIDWANNEAVPMNRGWIFSCYVRVPVASAANQDFIFGMITDYNATLASTTKYVWFRLSGASMTLNAESKDGATTTLIANAALNAYTFPTNSFVMLTIAARSQLERNSGFAEFWVEDSLLGKTNIAAGVATDMLQPLIGVAKSTGTTAPTLDIDWARVTWDRF